MRRYGDWIRFGLALVLLWQWSSGIKDALVWIGFLVVVVQGVRTRTWPSLGGVGYPLLAWLVIAGYSAFITVQTPESASNYVKLLTLVAGFVALVNLLRPSDRLACAVRSLALAYLVLALADIGHLILNLRDMGNPDLWNPGDKRWMASLFGYPTVAAGALAPGFVLCLAYALGLAVGRERILFGAGAALIGALIFIMQAESVMYLGIPAAVVVLFLVMKRDRAAAWRRAILIPGAIGLVIAAIAIPNADRLPHAFASLTDPTGTKGHEKTYFSRINKVLSNRDKIWAKARQAISAKPMGHGYGHETFEPIFYGAKQERIEGKQQNIIDHAHNLFLEVAVQTGLAGLLIWCWLIAAAVYRVTSRLPPITDHNRRMRSGALLASLVALMVYGQFSVFFALLPIFSFWNLLALALASVDPVESKARS